MWQVTCDTWHMTDWLTDWLTDYLNKWMGNKGACRTAPATEGLLILAWCGTCKVHYNATWVGSNVKSHSVPEKDRDLSFIL